MVDTQEGMTMHHPTTCLDHPDFSALRETISNFYGQPGALTPDARVALGNTAGEQARGGPPPKGGIVTSLNMFAKKVARWAYRILDEDIDALKAMGHSEDEIFEATTAASLGVSIAQLERAVALLDGTPLPTQMENKS